MTKNRDKIVIPLAEWEQRHQPQPPRSTIVPS